MVRSLSLIAAMLVAPCATVIKAPSKLEEEINIETIKKLPKMYFTNITGGEPFIRTDLKDIVRELYKKSD